MGLVAFGEQTVPSGIAALLIAMMPVWVAILGRHLLRRAAAADGGRRDRRRLRRRRRSSSARRRSAVRAPSSRSGSPRSSSRRSRGRAARCSPRIGPTLPRRPLVATRRPDGRRRARPRRHGRRVTGELGQLRRRRDRHARVVRRRSLYLTVVGSLSRSRPTAGCCAGRAAAARLDLRLRQPGRRCRSSARSSSARPIDPRTIVAGAIIVAAVALIVTARGRMLPTARRARSRRQPSRGRGPGRRADRAPRPPDRRSRLGEDHPRRRRRARAMIVIIGLTPIAVGKTRPSPT